MKKLSTLDKLAAFLPYGVETQGATRTNPLTAELYAQWISSQSKGIEIRFKPILRPFSHLTREILLPNGERGTPAVEVAKMANVHVEGWFVHTSISDGYGIHLFSWDLKQQCRIDHKWDVSYSSKSAFDGTFECWPHSNQVRIIDFLRSCHFAVSFGLDEYIEKEI